jgi:hypothetical protein
VRQTPELQRVAFVAFYLLDDSQLWFHHMELNGGRPTEDKNRNQSIGLWRHGCLPRLRASLIVESSHDIWYQETWVPLHHNEFTVRHRFYQCHWLNAILCRLDAIDVKMEPLKPLQDQVATVQEHAA